MNNNSRQRESRRRSALGKELAPLPNPKEMIKLTTHTECVEWGGLSPGPQHPLPDKGKPAMLFMMSAFTIEALLWGT